MLKFFEREQWVKEILKCRKLHLNEQEFVATSLAKNFKLEPKYIAFFKKNKLVISFLAYTYKKEIKIPIHFFYSAFWADEKLSDANYAECVNEFLRDLQFHFNKIEILLPLYIKDIRPFLWSDFLVENRYTYLKNLQNLDYHPVTTKNIAKTISKKYHCKAETLNKESLHLNLQLFIEKGFLSKSKISKIEHLLKDLAKTINLVCYNCYLDGKLLASNILFLDDVYKIAYTVLLSKANKNKDDIHSLLHHYFFTNLKEKGFEMIDLLGADMMNISAFKSRFNANLHPHFLVRYSKTGKLIMDITSKTKNAAKKILNKVS